MADLPVAQAVPDDSAVARQFARELVAARDRMARYYAERDKVTMAEAATNAGAVDIDWNEQTKHTPADQVTWWALHALADADPDAAQAVWERVKQAAFDELATGDRAARVLEWDGDPLQRARFLVLRASFRDEWRPGGGIEAALVDTLAQAYSGQEFWQEQLQRRATTQSKAERWERERKGEWTPPLMAVGDAIEQAATMADRFNRLFLRTLRALRDLRRYSSPVVIQNAGQVNVGGQQVNVSASPIRPQEGS